MPSKIEKLTLKLQQKIDGPDIYWKSRLWNTTLPTYFILSNHPSNQDLAADDLTGMLVQNAVLKLGGGSATIGNLFSRPIHGQSEKQLGQAFSDDSMNELTAMASKHEHIIIGTGSLIYKSDTAKQRLREFIKFMRASDCLDKIQVLVAQDGQSSAHPLSGSVRALGSNWNMIPFIGSEVERWTQDIEAKEETNIAANISDPHEL